MSEQFVIEQCAPTLAGIKSANLFSIETEDLNEAMSIIRDLNDSLHNKGIRVVPAGRKGKRQLIYLYRPNELRKDLSAPEAEKILREQGYPVGKLNLCVTKLIGKIRSEGDFPHEVGLFLSYPPEDVLMFMRSPKEGVRYVGYWKVYDNVERAKETFRKYRICSECYKREFKNGKSLADLAVATAG